MGTISFVSDCSAEIFHLFSVYGVVCVFKHFPLIITIFKERVLDAILDNDSIFSVGDKMFVWSSCCVE